MAVQLKNNARGYLSTAITAADTGIALELDDGDAFPALGVGDYFYATIQATDGTKEIVKVTALSGDSITVVRAQEGTTALPFTAGAAIELRITAQQFEDAVVAYSAGLLEQINTWLFDQTFDAIINMYGGNKVRWYNSSDANPHGIRNNANALTWDYNGTDYMTASSAGIVNFLNSPTIAGSYVYRAGGTDIPVTDGGTGASDASTARTNLGLAIGSNVQAYSAALTDFAAQTIAADKLVYGDGSNSFAVTDFPSFARTLLANTTAADARTDLGLGTMATQAASAVAITGGSATGLSALSGTPEISSETTGTLTDLSANKIVNMTGDVTFTASQITAPAIILLYTGASARSAIQGSGMTVRLDASATTGTRNLAARSIIVAYVVSSTEVIIGGKGAT